MVVEATYVLCTSNIRTIEEKEARHREKVLQFIFVINLKFRTIHVFNVKTVLPQVKLRQYLLLSV